MNRLFRRSSKKQQESIEELKKQNKVIRTKYNLTHLQELQQQIITLKQSHISLQRELDILKPKVATEAEDQHPKTTQTRRIVRVVRNPNGPSKTIVPPKLVIEKPKVKRISRDQQMQDQLECPICYDEKSVVELSCSHFVCEDCLKKFESYLCPICRVSFEKSLKDIAIMACIKRNVQKKLKEEQEMNENLLAIMGNFEELMMRHYEDDSDETDECEDDSDETDEFMPPELRYSLRIFN